MLNSFQHPYFEAQGALQYEALPVRPHAAATARLYGEPVLSRSSPYCRVPSDWLSDPSLCWFEWQAFLGSGLAVLAGAGTIYFLWRQVTQSEKHEEERLDRQHRAIRTTLPLALSGICAEMKTIMAQLAEAKRAVKKDGSTKSFVLPPPPTEHVDDLKAVVASTDERSVSEPIAQIIREIQTLWARIEVLQSKTLQRRRAGLTTNITEWIIQASEVHALTESLFAYSRGEAETGPTEVKIERSESVIFQLGIEDQEIVQSIKNQLENSEAFWMLD